MKLLIVLITILLSGCVAPTTGSAWDELAARSDMVCEYKAKTGSKMKKRVCMSKDLSDQIMRENQAALKSLEHKGQTSAGSTM